MDIRHASENKGTTACMMSRDFAFWKVACQRLQTCTPGMFRLRELLNEDPGLGFWILIFLKFRAMLNDLNADFVYFDVLADQKGSRF